MRAWQAEWDEFNRQPRSGRRPPRSSAPASTTSSARCSSSTAPAAPAGGAADPGQRHARRRGRQLIGAAREQEALASLNSRQLLRPAGASRISATASGTHEQESRRCKAAHHDLRGRLSSLETLQQAALGQRSGQVSGWLESRGLRERRALHRKSRSSRAGSTRSRPCWASISRRCASTGWRTPGTCWPDSITAPSPCSIPGRRARRDRPATPAALTARCVHPGRWHALLNGVYAADTLGEALARKDSLDVRRVHRDPRRHLARTQLAACRARRR